MLTDASNDDDDQPDLHFTIYLNPSAVYNGCYITQVAVMPDIAIPTTHLEELISSL